MQLKNPFHDDVRWLFFDVWECWICKGNGNGCGGLELHHIKGRESNSAMNAAILCGKCHSTMGHSDKEERELLQKTAKFLCKIRYKFTSKDIEFYAKNKKQYE